MVVLLNRGQRTWDLHDAVEVEGKLVRRERREDGSWNPEEKVVKRQLPPGGSIEAIDAKEAKQMLAYHREIVDAEKALPVVGDKLKELTEKVVALTDEVNSLRERLAKYEPAEEGNGEKKGKGKGK